MNASGGHDPFLSLANNRVEISWSTLLDTIPNPHRELRLANLTSRNREHHCHRLVSLGIVARGW